MLAGKATHHAIPQHRPQLTWLGCLTHSVLFTDSSVWWSSVTEVWPSYQATAANIHELLWRAHNMRLRHEHQLRDTQTALDHLTARLDAQDRNIRDFAIRLALPGDPLAHAQLPPPPPGTAQGHLDNAHQQANAADHKLHEAEQLGQQPAFMPGVSDFLRGMVVGFWFMPLPLIGVSLINITGFFSFFLVSCALAITGVVASKLTAAVYPAVGRPRLKIWRVDHFGHYTLHNGPTYFQRSSYLAVWGLPALVYLVKLFV